MIIKYHNTIEDLIALQRYGWSHSPFIKKIKIGVWVFVSVYAITPMLFLPLKKEFSRPFAVASAVVSSIIFVVLSNLICPLFMQLLIWLRYKWWTTKGVLGEHELEIVDDGFIERTEVNETFHSWNDVKRISQTEDHAFIFISAIAAHIIPKQSVTAGDPVQFIARTQQLWEQEHQEYPA